MKKCKLVILVFQAVELYNLGLIWSISKAYYHMMENKMEQQYLISRMVCLILKEMQRTCSSDALNSNDWHSTSLPCKVETITAIR